MNQHTSISDYIRGGEDQLVKLQDLAATLAESCINDPYGIHLTTHECLMRLLKFIHPAIAHHMAAQFNEPVQRGDSYHRVHGKWLGQDVRGVE